MAAKKSVRSDGRPAVALPVDDAGTLFIHTDRRGNPALRKEFDKALASLDEGLAEARTIVRRSSAKDR